MKNKPASRQPHNQFQHRLKPVYAAVLLALSVQAAQANPVGGAVVNGSAGFTTSGNTLTVTNTPGTIINWQGFSIGSSEATYFAQQSSSSTVLNRVVGNDPSNVLGRLGSNGRVFLVNPNGILFGAGAIVDVAGLVASTLNLSDADFLAGNYHFTAVPGAANVSNAGNITSQDNGQIFLIAPNVENTGVITAPNGEILLAAGASVDLVNTNDPNLRVSITAPAGDATNIGQLIASSGSLGLFGAVVRNSGIVNADSATLQGGKIVFKASQLAEISGTVSANGTTGGNIEVLGNQVGVLDGATISANGAQGGGTILIGGDAHGANPDVPNAQFTYVAPTATISADAVQTGDGGKVVVWADNATQFGGNISARGGAISGNGGWVEVSGKQWLGYAGLVNTTAAHGLIGSLLLDPMDITISNAIDTVTMIPTPPLGGTVLTTFADATALTTSNLNVTTLTTQLGFSDVTVDTTSALGLGAGNITVQDSIAWNSANSLTLNATSTGVIIVNALDTVGAPLTISNTSTGNLSLMTVAGSITLDGGISLAGGTLTANAGGATSDVIFSSAINTGAGAIDLTAGQSITELAGGSLTTTGLLTTKSAGGTILNGANAVDSFAATNTGSGNIELTNTSLNLALAGISQTGAGAVMVTNTGSITSTGVINSDGDVTLNSTDLIAINNSIISTLPINLVLNHGAAGNVTMAGTLDLTVGNLDIQNAGVSGTGTLNVTGGTVTLAGALTAGTYAQSGGTWNQVIPTPPAFTVNDFSITGGTFIRALGGVGSIADPYQLADIYGVQGMGSAGMLGNSYVLASDIDASLTSGWNVGLGFAPVAGFTGQFDGLGHTISGLYINRPLENDVGLFGSVYGGGVGNVVLANANVTGLTNVGALVGSNGYLGTIFNSSVSGNVNGTSAIGGLVGYNSGTISNSNAAGTMSGSNSVGGLVGNNIYGTIINSYVSSGMVWGNSNLGGLVGNNSYYTGYSLYNGLVNNSHYDIDAVWINDTSGDVTLGGLYTGQYNDWITNLTLDIANYSSLSGSDNNYTISDAQGMRDLLGFADNANYKFTLTADIDLNNDADLYIPYLAAGFNGSDGTNFYTISNLSVSQSFNDNLGLFGRIALGTTVSNVTLLNANVTGNHYVGALAGLNEGTVSNSHASGGSVNGISAIGGLVGHNYGSSTIAGVFTGGIISKSSASNVSVSGGSSSSSSSAGGLVGRMSAGGKISGSFVNGGTVSGGNAVGGLVGYDSGEGIVQSNTVTGVTVNGNDYVGGLAGRIAYSYSAAAFAYYDDDHVVNSFVNGGVVSGGSYVGGLAGYNSVPISNSSVIDTEVTATASGTSANAGGLVGYNAGTISGGSYVTGGTVSATGNNVGGLVGSNDGDVISSYVSGNKVISAVSSSSGNAGGLVGYNSGTISNSFASNGSVSVSTGGGTAWYMGGLVGNNAGSISNTYASGGTVSGGSSVGGLVGYNSGSISNSYASSGSLSGGGSVGGVVGYNDFSGSVGASFWNTTTAGVSVVNGIGYDATAYGGTDIGATGLDSAGMMTMSNFTAAGWDISNTFNSKSIWTIYEGVTMPLLSSFLVPPVIPPLVVDGVANVLDQIVYITDQRPKPKPEDLLVTEDISTGVGGNTLPMCN